MSGSITGITLSNATITDNQPVGTQVGVITVTMSDGSRFAGTLTLSGIYASLFSVLQVRDPYAISAISLSNASLPSNPAVGSLVGTITVTMSDQTAFAGTLTVNNANFSISARNLLVAATLTNGQIYPITITAADPGSTNGTLAANFQISVQGSLQVPGPLVNILSLAHTTSTIDVSWFPPTTGGVLDNGVHQIQYKASASATWLNTQPVTYCTPTHGSIVDATGATWTVNGGGNPVINGTFTDTTSTVLGIYRSAALIWKQDQLNAWWTSPGGIPPTWTRVFNTSPFGLTVSSLTPATAYDFRGHASNSAGTGPDSTPVTISTDVPAVGLPGAPTVGVATQTSNSMTIAYTMPTTGGALNAGVFQVQYKTAASGTYLNATISRYTTVNAPSFTDSFGNVWTIAASGGGQANAVMSNNVFTGGYNALMVVVIGNSIYHLSSDGAVWYSAPLSGAVNGTVNWANIGTTSPLQIPGIVISGLTTGTYNVRGFATNTAGQGANSSVLNVTISAGQSGTAPPMAAAVGYNLRTLGPNVTIGSNWIITAPTVTQNGDGSVTATEDFYHANNQLSTTPDGGNFQGVAFGMGGYFEIDMKIDGPILGEGGDPTGWSAWWANNIEGLFNQVPNPRPDQVGIEYDAIELLNPGVVDYNAGIILWSGSGQTYTNTDNLEPNGVPLPPGFSWGVRRKYGWLWVPATNTTQGYLKNYRDNVQVGRTFTWNLYQNTNWQDSHGDPWAVLDQCKMRLMFGSPQGSPMTVYTVTVWQATDANNRRTIPLPP